MKIRFRACKPCVCNTSVPRSLSDISVVLRRTGATWKVIDHDGGAYAKESLKSLGVPAADIPALLKAYQ